MFWTNKKPTFADYYWAIPKDRNTMLDASPEIVKVYYDGKWKVFRPGDNRQYKIEDFEQWSNTYIVFPEGAPNV